MSLSYAEKNTPFVLSPESLDQHLARGWYRMGSSIFTTHFLFFNQRPYSAIWLRVDLSGFKFSKSQRKLLRRNAGLFETACGPRVIDAEREALYKAYAEDFDGRLSDTIAESLEDYGEECVFNTFETTVRERVSGQLVAASYFDLGDNSVASILGIYQPSMASFSLGYYTMLLEMQYCLENGINYYYPGYVVPGYKRFDYKLRLGPSEYYNLQSGTWRPYSAEEVAELGSTEIQVTQLTKLVERLAAAGIQRSVLTYPLFEADLYDSWDNDYLPYPYLIVLGIDPKGDPIILVYDPKIRHYLILHCAHLVQSQLLFNAGYLAGFSDGDYYKQLLTMKGVLFRSNSITTITNTITKGLQKP